MEQKQVILKRMEIDNFKCFKHEEFDFNSSVVRFSGPNGSGKTSLYDAYQWLITGYDSQGTTAFKVQPLNASSHVEPKIETRVMALFSVNGELVRFEKVLSQCWVKPSGCDVEEFKGHDTTYLVDGVPMTKGKYVEKVTEYLCSQEDFKLISSLGSFFNLSVQDRRRKLMEMAGSLPELLTERNYPHLYARYLEAKSVDGVKKTAQFAIRDLKSQLESIPARKSENERSLPTDVDFPSAEKKLAEVNAELAKIKALKDKSSSASEASFAKQTELRKAVLDASIKVDEVERDLKKQIADKSDTINATLRKYTTEKQTLEQQITAYNRSISEAESNIAIYRSKLQELKGQYDVERAKNPQLKIDNICPTCGKPFTQEEMQTTYNNIVSAFNKGKAETLKVLLSQGETFSKMMTTAQESVDEYKKSIAEAQGKVESLNEKIAKHSSDLLKVPDIEVLKTKSKVYAEAVSVMEKAQEELNSFMAQPLEDDDLDLKVTYLESERDAVITVLALKENVKRVEARRKELDEEGARISAELAEQEQILHEVRQYNKAFISMVEESVSGMFTLVKFKMYEQNITNDGEKEICECIVDGVPYSTNINTAKRVNADIDIVNAIAKSIGVCVPLWVDNKESVTSLIPTPSQIITLEVENCEKLHQII